MATISKWTIGGVTYDVLDKNTSEFAQELATRLAALEGKSLIDIKGSVASADDLPSSDVENGDAYFVGGTGEDKSLYIRTADGWEDAGVIPSDIDLSGYVSLEGEQTIMGSKTFAAGLKTNSIYPETAGEPVKITAIDGTEASYNYINTDFINSYSSEYIDVAKSLNLQKGLTDGAGKGISFDEIYNTRQWASGVSVELNAGETDDYTLNIPALE